MRNIIIVLLLSLFVLSACERQKPDVEIPLPDQGPDLSEMSPTSSPNL